MRFPSLRLIGEQTATVARRFPLVVASALIATIGAIVAFEGTQPWSPEVRLLLGGGLGLPAFVAVGLTFERWPHRAGQILAHALIVILLTGFYFAWPHWTNEVGFRRYAQLTLAAHLAASFLPFWRGRQLQGFWQYNKALLLRFLTAQLFAHVLFAGLVVALVALEQLFGIDVPERLYPRLWAAAALLFATLYFLGGVPRTLEALEDETSYPPPLKVLAQYILLPIVAVYLVILTAYLGKVLITRQWPSGWIGYLVSSVSLLGVLSLLLLFPVQHRQENRWVATYGRLLYVALLPALGMLIAAVGKRVDQYGVTENRYFLLVLAVWLAVLCIAYLATRSRDIRWIPMSLCAVALVTSFGPWDPYHVSRRDQLGRLRELLAQNEMLENGTAVRAAGPVSADDRREIAAVLTYLMNTHGARSVRAVMPDAWAALDPAPGPRAGRFDEGRDLVSSLMSELDLAYVDPRTPGLENRVVSFGALPKSSGLLEVAGFQYLIRLQAPPLDTDPSEYTVLYDEDQEAWVLRDRGGRTQLTIALDEVIAAVAPAEGSTAPGTAPVILDSTGEPRWRLVVYSLYVDAPEGGRRTVNVDAHLLFNAFESN